MDAAWKIVIAAGGTGGHISPALAVAEHLREVEPTCRIAFVCGTRPVERTIYERANIEPQVIDFRPTARAWMGMPITACRLFRALRRTRVYLRAERPHVVLGTGGYVSVPVVLAASGRKVPTMIHEQNAVAGKANRWLARRVQAVACGYEAAADAFPRAKSRVTGNPVRAAFIGCERPAALRRWDLADDRPTVLVFGGSQGARRLNEAVLGGLASFDSAASGFGGLQLLWICGENNFDSLNERLGRMSLQRAVVRLVPFVREMGLAYAAADLAIARAGAMALAELTANGVASILVPLPGATADHQRRNARPLVEAGAAVVVDDAELTARRLVETVATLLADRPRLGQMREASRGLGRPDAAAEIVDMILELRGELP